VEPNASIAEDLVGANLVMDRGDWEIYNVPTAKVLAIALRATVVDINKSTFSSFTFFNYVHVT
jgi:hypothetical protein